MISALGFFFKNSSKYSNLLATSVRETADKVANKMELNVPNIVRLLFLDSEYEEHHSIC